VSGIIERAKSNYKRDVEGWEEIYQAARGDMLFLSDDKYAQWEQRDYKSRLSSSRPTLTIDQLGQFVHQVANSIRMNTPSINIIPSGSNSNVETAEVFKGLIRNIEYTSNADDAYDTASLNSIKSSFGFIRVDHDYIDEKSFDQHLLIKRIVNPLSVHIDCNSTECDGSDAKHATIIDSILVSEFKKKYPDAEVSCFEDEKKTGDTKDGDYITIAEYFEIEESESEMGMADDGAINPTEKDGVYKNKRVMKKRTVNRYVLSGAAILEETKFPGKYIPIVPVYGEESWIEGKRKLYSLIRKSKDAQRMFNYWKSLETELLMKQPNSPFIAAEGTTEDYDDDYKNPGKSIVLRYKTTDAAGNPAQAPQRLAPPTIPTGIVDAARAAVDDIKATMGLYGASLGQRSNETSGIAIQRRNQQGDVATFHFNDNLMRSIAHVGKILVCAIPEIYDTSRVIRIIGLEDEPKEVGVNGQIVEGQKEQFDLTQGVYDVRVITGASYTTKRQEAAAFFTDIVSKQPDLMQVMGDLLFKNMDFTGAEAMADRMKKVIGNTNPELLEDNEDEIDPQVMQLQAQLQEAAAAMQELQSQMQQMGEDAENEIETLNLQLENKQAETKIKGASEQSKAHTESGKLELESLKIQQDHEFKMAALQLKQRELDIKEAELLHKHAAMMQPDTGNINQPQSELGYPNS